MERNRILSLQSHGKALKKECCLPGVFRDSGDTPANLLCELSGHLMPCTSCFYGKWVEDVCAGQFGVYSYIIIMPPAVGGRGITRYRNPPVCLSVCPSPWCAAALGYRHAGRLPLSCVRTADPSADGRRSAASRTAIGGGISSRRPRGDNLLIQWTSRLAR